MTGLDNVLPQEPEEELQEPRQTRIAQRLQEFEAARQPPPEAAEAAPEPPNGVAALIQQQNADSDRALRANYWEALKANPDLAGEAQRLGLPTGLDPLAIERNIDSVRQKERQRVFESEGIGSLTPELRKKLESDPFFARIAHDDIGQLSTLESVARTLETTAGELGALLFGAVGIEPQTEVAKRRLQSVFGRAEAGVVTSQRGFLGQRVRERGDRRLTTEEREQLDSLNQTLASLPLESPGLISGLANMVGQISQSIPEVATDTLAAASAGATAGAVGGPLSPITAPAGAALAAPVGTIVGVVRSTAEIEGGNLFLDMIDQGVPADVAAPASGIAGVIMGALEAVGLKLVAAPFRKVIRDRITGAVKENLVKPVVAKEVAKRAASATGIVAGNVVEEIAQELVSRQAQSAVGLDPGDFGDSLGAIIAETIKGTALLGFGGASVQLASDLQRADAAEQNHQQLDKLIEAAKGSATRTRNSVKWEEFAGQAIKGDVFIDAQAMGEAFQQNDISRAQVEEAFPGLSQQLEEATAAGGDVVIPMPEYVSKLADSEIDGILRQDVRIGDPENPSARQAEAFRKDETAQAEVQKLVEESIQGQQDFETSGRAVESRTLEQIKAAGAPGLAGQEKAAAFLHRQLVETQAQRLNITPEEFDALHPLTVTGERLQTTETVRQERLPPEGALLNEEGQPQVLFHQTTEQGAAGIREEGFDVTRVGARATDAQVPNGIFLKPTDEDIGVTPGEPTVQEPVFASIQNPLQVQNREEMEATLREDARYEGLLDDLETLDRERALEHRQLEGAEAEAFAEQWRTDHSALAAKARGRAAQVLLKRGHDGVIIEEDVGAEGRTTKTVIAFRPSQVQSTTEEGIFRQEGIEDPRGEFDPKNLKLRLTAKSDFSSWVHELGHYYLTILGRMAAAPGANESVVSDMQTLVGWFGVESIEAWNSLTFRQQQKHHETLAVNMELYFFSGKAPSTALEKIFQKIRGWIVRVYETFKSTELRSKLSAEFKEQFGVELPDMNDNVRRVFDRMLAADKAVSQMEAARSMLPLFQTQEESRMSDDAWQRYQDGVEEAHEAAVTDLGKASLRQMQWLTGATEGVLADLQKEHRRVRGQTKRMVEGEVAAEPVRVAQRFLRAGKIRQPDGTEIDAEGVHKLNTEFARALIPDGDVKRLAGMTTREGLHPDDAAGLLGFRTGRELVGALLTARPLAEEVSERTDARMMAEHSELADPEQRQRAAEKALHNRARARFVAVEWKALAGALQPVRDITAAAKLAARDAIAKLPVGRIRPHVFAGAEARAAKDAQQASKAGDPEAAIAAKRRQLLQHHMAKEAARARDEIESAHRLFKKLRKPDSKLAQTRNVDFIGGARAVLAAHGLGPAATGAQPHMDLIAQYNAPLHSVLKPMVDKATEDGRNWKELSLEEFRLVKDTVEAMWNNSRRDKVVMIEGKRVELAEVEQEIVAALDPPDRPKRKSPVTDKERKSFFHQRTAWLRRVESWLIQMDGGRPGALHRLLFTPLSDSHNNYTLERAKVSRAVMEEFRKLDLGDGQKIPVQGLGNFEFFNNKAELLGALRNAGNESNLRKLMLGYEMVPELREGEAFNPQPFWDAIEQLISDGVITRQDMDYVQFVWDQYEALLDRTQQTHFDVYGFRMEPIPAKEIELSIGTFRGGYVPVRFDPAARQRRTDRRQTPDPLTETFGVFREGVSARPGFGFSRVEFNRPLLLDARLDAHHIDEHLRFLHMASAATDTMKILRRPAVADAFADVDEKTALIEEMFVPWVTSTFHNQVMTPGQIPPFLNQMLSSLRRVSGLGIMFGNLKVGLQQLSGLGISAQIIPLKFLRSSSAAYTRGGLADKASEKSKFMQLRIKEKIGQMRDDMDVLINPGWLTGAREWLARDGFFIQRWFQTPVDIITWDARYEQAVSEGKSETDAIADADAAVRTTQGGGRVADLSRLEKGNAIVRLLLQFSNFWFTAMNLVLSERTTAARIKRLTGASLFAGLTAGLLTEALKGGWEDDDDDGALWDDVTSWAIGETLGAAAAISLPVVGPAVAQAITGEFGGRVTLAGAATGQVTSAGRAVGGLLAPLRNLFRDDEEIDLSVSGSDVKDLAALLTLATGLPFTQVGRSIGYAVDVGRGEIEPSGTTDLIRGVLTGAASPGTR